MNQGFTAFTEKTLPELNRDGWLSLYHDDDRQEVRMAWADSVATGLPFRGEWRVRRGQADEYVWHLVSATPLRDAAQQLLHWNGFMADINVQKVMAQTMRDNEELRQTQSQLENNRHQLAVNNDELSRSNTELSQFAYVASHDLREPLRKIQNLLSNALKFTPPDRVPSVQISALPRPSAHMQALYPNASGDFLEVSVQDNGIGFEQKHVERIFNLFQRLHGRNEFAGTGIGLAVCKKVVDNHGGYLTASSQPGQGATFLIYLPMQ